MSFGEIKDTNVPCFMCKPPIRHEGCHGTCERYLTYKENKEKENELKRIQSDLSIGNYIRNYKMRNHRK